MIDGMRSDVVKTRYRTYAELYEYCYRVAGTVALMTMPVMGMDRNYKVRTDFRGHVPPDCCTRMYMDRDSVLVQGKLEPVYRAALALGTANQLTNILRDVGEDMRERNRIYIPLDELAKFNISEEELMSGMRCSATGKMDDRYVRFMQYMVCRFCCTRLPIPTELLSVNVVFPLLHCVVCSGTCLVSVLVVMYVQ